ncbi:MAG: hypothetical protein HXY50_14985 [Ignavibacteriaceae bacterium]|nr:hypothetical protein [Ignavibacteriaceae bacterium]
MNDIIFGIVESIIDSNSFLLHTTEVSLINTFKYNKWERIKVNSIQITSKNIMGNKLTRKFLEKEIHGKAVRCSIQLRENSGRIKADVVVI